MIFHPKSSKVFQTATFVRYYSGAPMLLLRGLLWFIFIASLAAVGLGYIQEDLSALFLFLLGLSLFFVMFELFYHLELTQYQYPTTDNLADRVSLHTATIILDATNIYQLFKKILKLPDTHFILLRCNLNPDEIKQIIDTVEKEGTEFFPVEQILTEADRLRTAYQKKTLNHNDVLAAYFNLLPSLRQLLFDSEIKIEDLMNVTYWQESQVESFNHSWFDFTPTLGFAANWAAGYTLTLESLARNLSEELGHDSFASAFVGRDKEIDLIETVLSRTTKRNVLLVGDPGVGKTSIIKGIVLRALEGKSPPLVSFKRFFELNVTSLLAGTQTQGDLEERIKTLIEEMRGSNVILVIPQIQNVTGSKNNVNFDISGVLENYLKEGNLQVIATANQAEYRRDIEPKSSFLEDFEVVHIEEPTPEETILIVERVAPLLERRYRMLITYKALQKTVTLAEKVEPDRLYPGKAIALLDEILAYYAAHSQKRLEPEMVVDFLQTKTKIPLQTATAVEAKKLLNLESDLKKRVVGQDYALKTLALAMQRARTLIKDPDKPIGVFLFLGPTGVGKTETAKSLATQYFGSEEEMIRLDMSEYQENTAVLRLIGTPEAPESGQLTTKVHEKPYSLLLLDELEKANPKVLDLFLQVFDEGHITDGAGRKVKFSNTIIIATSNAGSEVIREKINEKTDLGSLKPLLLDFLQRQAVFKPEFLNRFDDVVIYQPLTTDEIKEVTKLQISYLAGKLKQKQIVLEVTDETLGKLSQIGYDPVYGARALKRVITEKIENPLATLLLEKNIQKNATVTVSLDPSGEVTLNAS